MKLSMNGLTHHTGREIMIEIDSLARKNINPSFCSQIVTSILIGMLMINGCMFADLKKEIQESNISYGIEGRVTSPVVSEGNMIILLYRRENDGPTIDQFTVASDAGRFSFIVTPGTYILAGFEDRNANLRHDKGEPAGIWNHGTDIVVFEGPKTDVHRKALLGLNFELMPGKFPLTDAIVSVENVDRVSVSLLKIGTLADWEDPIFDDEHGSTGFWKPMTFLKQFGVGVYFIEPFDAKKIPILFVHGANGTPRGWKTLAYSLDSRRYQPWVYYYPSGIRLDRAAFTLNEIVKRLQKDYGFTQMGVVAHSMGGLVSRAFIIKHQIDDGLVTVRVFVSISTPWGGVRMAAKGLEHAPEAIPSWHDVAPQSEFIKVLYSEALFSQVPHHLIFGYQGDCSLFMANNDGTVELSSQLDVRAQDDAATVRGLDEDHMSILFSKKTMAYMNQVINSKFQ